MAVVSSPTETPSHRFPPSPSCKGTTAMAVVRWPGVRHCGVAGRNHREGRGPLANRGPPSDPPRPSRAQLQNHHLVVVYYALALPPRAVVHSLLHALPSRSCLIRCRRPISCKPCCIGSFASSPSAPSSRRRHRRRPPPPSPPPPPREAVVVPAPRSTRMSFQRSRTELGRFSAVSGAVRYVDHVVVHELF